MTPTAAIRRCIAVCASSRDGRGAWRAERACAADLGGSSIDRNTAAAARRLGEWLRDVGRGDPLPDQSGLLRARAHSARSFIPGRAQRPAGDGFPATNTTHPATRCKKNKRALQDAAAT